MVEKKKAPVEAEAKKKDVFNLLNINPKKEDCQVKLITPEIAKELLKLNTKVNELRLSTPIVQKYKKAMLENNWGRNNDALSISITGMLINGQHRLFALISANKAFSFNISTGHLDSDFGIIDTPFKRSLSQIFKLGKHSHSTILASVVPYLMKYNGRGNFLNIPTSYEVNVQNYYLKHKEQIDFAVGMAQGCVREVPKSIAVTLFYKFNKISPNLAHYFINCLKPKGVYISNEPTGVLLKELRIVQIEGARDRRSQLYIWAIIIKAWNCYRNNKTKVSIRSIRWYPHGTPSSPVSQPFPEII